MSETAVETAADDETEAETTETATETAAEAAKPLGDAGKQAIDRMKAERNAERAKNRELAEKLAALEAAAEGREAEHKAAQEAQRVKDEALNAANERILKAELRAAAAGKLSDPADALKFLNLSEFEVDSDGGVDQAALASAIDDLITTKPYLAAQSGKRFEGAGDGGIRNGAKPSQLTRGDVERLAREGKHAEIQKAREEGRLEKVLGHS